MRMDGILVAPWIWWRLRYARRHGWKGRVLSGHRSRQRQLHAAQQYAARVGRSLDVLYPSGVYASHHLGWRFPSGAVDVTDWEGLRRAMTRWASEGKPRPLLNGIAGDLGHFSASGH
jgi:hypothetical protein